MVVKFGPFPDFRQSWEPLPEPGLASKLGA